MSIFNTPGLYIRTPGGNVEDVEVMKTAGFRWVALNVGDHPLPEWQTQLQRCQAAGMPVLPWRYVRTEADIQSLCNMARQMFGGKVIINAERELWRGEITIDQIVRGALGLDAALSVEPIPAHEIEWHKVAHMMVHVGLFPQENAESKDPRYCRAQYFLYGCKRVSFMDGNHDLTPIAFPPRATHFGAVYTADDCKDFGQTYSHWAPETIVPLSLPYTGPYYHNQFGKIPTKGSTVKALKRAMHNAGYAHFTNPDAIYNQNLKDAMIRFQTNVGLQASGNYGLGSYEALKTLASAIVGQTYAVDQFCLRWLEEDA